MENPGEGNEEPFHYLSKKSWNLTDKKEKESVVVYD